MKYPTVLTKLVFLLGNPLGHSLSPAMHNRVFEKMELDYCYLPVETVPENLETVFNGLRHMNMAGCNVTIPHKIKIIDFLDKLDPLASAIGAVNTIRMVDGKTIGYNTDGEGFLRSLAGKTQGGIEDKNFFLMGCGGAGRAIAITLAQHGAAGIFICNRTPAKAEALAAEINTSIRHCSKALDRATTDILHNCQVLINSTSVGMHPDSDALPLDDSLILPHLTVADIVYNPLTTRLLEIAKKRGCTVVHGLGMLVHQGAAAFKLWTGVEADMQEMSTTVSNIFKKEQ